MSGRVRSATWPAYAWRKYSSAMRRPPGVRALRSHVPKRSAAPANRSTTPRSRSRSKVARARVAPAELPPIASLEVPKRASASSTSQSAAASQSSGAAGQGARARAGSRRRRPRCAGRPRARGGVRRPAPQNPCRSRRRGCPGRRPGAGPRREGRSGPGRLLRRLRPSLRRQAERWHEERASSRGPPSAPRTMRARGPPPSTGRRREPRRPARPARRPAVLPARIARVAPYPSPCPALPGPDCPAARLTM